MEKRGKFRFIFCALISSLVLYYPQLAKSDEIRLANGDLLSGQIIRMEKGTLVFKTPYAGDIRVSWAEIICLQSEKELTMCLKSREIIRGKILCAEKYKVKIISSLLGETPELLLGQIEAINPLPPPPAVKYKGSLYAGGSLSQGNTDEKAANVSLDFQARSKRHRFLMGSKFNYGESAGVVTTRNGLGSIKYDFFLKERLFTYAQAFLERDDFQDLNLRSTIGLGLGYQILDTPRTDLFLEGGLSYFNEDFINAADDHYATIREAIGLKWEIWPERIRLYHKHELYYSLKGANSYYWRAEQGLRFFLIRNFFANLEVNFKYTSNPAPGKKERDSNYIAGLGYEFSF